MGSSEPTIVYDLEDSIARVRLNRPPRFASRKGEPT
jgi:hypothetical protein